MAKSKRGAKRQAQMRRRAQEKRRGSDSAARQPVTAMAENTIRFTTTEPVPVEDVIRSLEGMDAVVRQFLPRAIYELTGARVTAAELLVEGLEEGSLIEKTIVTLVFKDEKNFQRFLLNVREQGIDWFKQGTPLMRGTAISILVAALVLGGLVYLSKDEPQSGALSNIQGDNNTVLIIGAEAYQTNPQAFGDAIQKAVPESQKKALGRASANFIAPSKSQPGAGVEIQANGDSFQAISPESVKAAPVDFSEVDSTFDRQLSNANLELRATDLDSTKKGWAATIDGIVEKRTRVVFAHEPDMLKVAHKPRFAADVTITFGPGLKPILITVDKVL